MSELLDVAQGRVVQVATVYDASALLGEGRFAEVYRAFHKPSRTDVALKIYRDASEKGHALAKSERDVLREVQRLGTPYFPQLQGFLRHRHSNRNHPLIVMELGQYTDDAHSETQIISLKDVLASGASDDSSVPLNAVFWQGDVYLKFILELCAAVRTLHGKAIIHRDLKPANILLKRPPGHPRPIPFVLDFNTSVRADMATIRGGTEQYLPPEVRCGKRTQPATADDLWAIARIACDIIFGVAVSLSDNAVPRSAIKDALPQQLRECMTKAMEVDPAKRYSTAAELYDAMAAVISVGQPQATTDLSLTIGELSLARESCERIRNMMAIDLANDDDLFVPKEVRELVAMLFAWLPEQTTRTWDLQADLRELGPRAIPAILELGYRIEPNTDDYAPIMDALTALGLQDSPLAMRAISHYGLSSSHTVRKMSRELCRRLKMCPIALVDYLSDDPGLLLSDERVDIADLIIRYSQDSDALLCLTKYMCREYILNLGGLKYKQLKQTIADRIGECQFDEKALLIVQDTSKHIWEELSEFRLIRNLKEREELSRGILQLMGDAFASLGEEALRLLKAEQVPRKCDYDQLPIWRTFVKKLAYAYPPAREWVEEMNTRGLVPEDLLDAIGVGRDEVPAGVGDDQVGQATDLYLANGNPSIPRWLVKQPQTLQLLDQKLRMSLSPPESSRVLDILEAFLSRRRGAVVRVVLSNWEQLADLNYSRAIDVLTKYEVPADLRDEAFKHLNNDLQNDARSLDARRGLERILEG